MGEQAPHHGQPEFHLTLHDGEEFLATPHTLIKNTFIGRTAINGLEIENNSHDHLLLAKQDEETGELCASYLFSQHPDYERLSQLVEDYEFPQIKNQPDLDDAIIQLYRINIDQIAQQLKREIPDYPPESLED